MSDPPPREDPQLPQDRLGYLWDRYKYHHDLCWKAVYKIVAVVVALAVLPYVKRDLTVTLWPWMLASPVLGTLFAAFGIFVLNNELRLFAEVKVAHHLLHTQFLESVLKQDHIRKLAVDSLNIWKARWTPFDIYVHLLMIILFLLSLGNTVFVASLWKCRLTAAYS